MNKLLCLIGFCAWKPTGTWHYSDDDLGTIWTCRCGKTEDRPGDCTGFQKEKTDGRG